MSSTRAGRQQEPHELASMRIASWDRPFDQEALAQLTRLLPPFLRGRRWFRAKARTIERLKLLDLIPIADAFVLVIEIAYQDGAPDRYLLPVSLKGSDSNSDENDAIAQLKGPDGKTGMLTDAISDEAFRQSLFDAVACNRTFEGQNGKLIAQRENALYRTSDQPTDGMESAVSRAEQSNTSIIYGKKYILKLFRKLEHGINPDMEIGAFLTRRGFENTPAVLGRIDYHSQGDQTPSAVAILQQFVPNQGDAWKYTLESLTGFFERARILDNVPELPAQHPLELMKQELPPSVRHLLGEYAESARLLGQRTAQMHATLTDENAETDFTPEPFTRADGEKLFQDLIAQTDISFELLRRKLATLSGSSGEDARRLQRLESEITNRFAPLREASVSTVRIRHHGDYHLGQVLYTGSDFMIIDFEGEPARTLQERRLKTLAMRDVAGMVRSFQYAAFTALFGEVPGVPGEGPEAGCIEGWATYWTTWVSAIYLRAYFDESKGLPSVPASEPERRLTLDAFLLQKALYELAYELNNRPAWVRIPLRGILSLVND
jgi:trehalose synthase-fused probable maltokinase